MLAGLALAGNAFHLPLFFGFDLIFGSIASFLALVWLGPLSGLFVAAAGSAYTFILWNHPYAILIFIAELLAVSAGREFARRRGRPFPPLALLDVLYWLGLGIPLVIVIYHFGLGMDWSQVALVALKQTLNGVLNSTLASIVLLAMALLHRPRGSIRIDELHFATLLMATLLPGLLLTAWDNRQHTQYMEMRLAQRLQLVARFTVQDWVAASAAANRPAPLATPADIARFSELLLGDEALQIRSVLQMALDEPADGKLRLRVPDESLFRTAQMKRYFGARYELAVPYSDERAVHISVSAAPLVKKAQEDALASLKLLGVLTGLALLIAHLGSRHLGLLLRQLTTSARALPVAIRDQVVWIAPPPSPFTEMDQLASTLELIGAALKTNFQLVETQRTNFRAFFDSLNDMVFITTLEGYILDFNPEVTRKLGYASYELLGTSILELHPAIFRQEAEQNVVQLCNGTSEGCTLPLVTKAGVQIPALARVWRGQWNGKECFFSISKDLSAEFAAREAMRQERELFASGPILTITWAMTDGWPIQNISANVTNLLGYTPAEMMHADFRYADLIHPDDMQGVFDEIQWYLKYRRDTFEQSYRLRLFSGEYRWFYDFTKVVRNEHGAVKEIRGYLLDQSHLKETQLALTRERQRLLNVIDGTRLGTWEWNIETGQLSINQYWADICGYTLAELVPISFATWQRLSHPDDLAKCEQRLQEHFVEGARYTCELRMRHKHGHWVWVLAEGSVVVRDAEGKPLVMAGTHTDISERKRGELDLRRREALDRLLVELATELVNAPANAVNLDAVIAQALRRLGRHLDRVYFYQADADGNLLTKTQEWLAPAAQLPSTLGHQLDLRQLHELRKLLYRNAPLIVPQCDQLPPPLALECAQIALPNAQSLLVVPVLATRLLGVIGLEAVRVPQRWSTNKTEFLRVYANLLASAMQRGQAFRSLNDSLARYDLLAQQTRSVAWEVDANGIFTYLSPLIESVLGYRPEELVGSHHFYDLTPEPEREALKAQALEIFARHGLFHDLVNPARHRDGRRVWLLTHGQPFFDAAGTLLGYRGADQDITIRQTALARLEESEARFRVVFDHAPLGIGIPDPQRRFIYVNHAYARLLGRERETLIGRCVDDMIHPDDRPAIAQHFAELTSGVRDSYQLNRRYLRPNGDVVWGDVRVTLIPNLADNAPLPVAMVEDITERLAAQEHNQQLQRELEATRERATIGHLASGIAHDFNNLLGVMDANLSYLGESLRENNDPEVAEVLDETQSALGHAKVITAGMLSLSRAGGMPCEIIELKQVFDELIAILRHLLPRSVEAHFDVAETVTAFSNAAFLQAALLNLVLNARDAMPDGGQLSVVAVPVADAPPPPRLGTAPAGAHVAIRVTDTGHGIRPDTLARIFEPLFSTKAKQRGHGLGLFMVQEFVLRSGAGLTVDSEVGEGTTFCVLLPSMAAESELEADGAVEIGAAEALDCALLEPLPKMERVLLVEDDSLVREALARLLTTHGFSCTLATHGNEALAVLASHPDVDWVLSDIAMPIMDGFSLFETLAREHPDLPVILMSGQDLRPDCHIDCEHHHAYCPFVLRKPFSIQQLMRTLEVVTTNTEKRCLPNFSTVLTIDKINRGLSIDE
ncbi:hypothetical protein CKO12_05310 [Chromatium okenii]|nr:hypothetical protein [Chromatium okenii]